MGGGREGREWGRGEPASLGRKIQPPKDQRASRPREIYCSSHSLFVSEGKINKRLLQRE